MKKLILAVFLIFLISSIFATVFVISKNMDNTVDEKTQESIEVAPKDSYNSNGEVENSYTDSTTSNDDKDTDYENLNDSFQDSKADSQYDNSITKSGEYVGQIDNNSIEIIVEKTPNSFRIEEAKTEFESLNLDTGDLVKIEYIVNEHNQNIILNIFKL